MAEHPHANRRSPAPRDASFPETFREAVVRRGLSLERIHERLREQGIRISLASLGHWQSGRSQPERRSSLLAVDALEEILLLPSGDLRSRLGPHRPRGRFSPKLVGVEQFYGEDSLFERALGREDAAHSEHITRQFVHESVRVNRDRRMYCQSVYQVARANRDGVTRLSDLHCLDEAPASVDIVMHSGVLRGLDFQPAWKTVVVDVSFGRRLRKNETAAVHYDVIFDPKGEAAVCHERRTRVNLRGYLLHVYFDAEAAPLTCHSYFREKADATKSRARPLMLDPSHSAHTLVMPCPVGVHGMSWQWPD
ncbi:XRE family transcriptional regulator [Streptomyces diacarni]|uniref:XRE family transcriptional regulator n=1 Tax=Streptomyces diacarni TaxID=2800381 RepID=UPI0033F2F349